jgi:hypothetical protein
VNHFARRKDYDYSLVFNATFNNISAISNNEIKPEALKSLYRSPGNKKKQLVLCKNYVLQW